MNRTLLIVLIAGLMVAGAALAAAPQPTRSVSASFYSGRWYEIARIPNAGQRDCEAPESQFARLGGSGDTGFISDTGEFSVRQVCHRGSPVGATRVFATRGRILPGSRNAKFELSFLGGVRKQEYWVIDTAPDGGWALMATPGGNYIWLLSRKAVMPAAAKAAAIARIRALGYGQTLEFPAQAG
jgi:apolipoprotein D and lipocalin family protein